MPKPHTLTPEVQERFLTNLARCGGFIQVAAALSKVKHRTLYDWFRRADTGEQPFSDFLEQVSALRAMYATEQIDAHRRLAQQNGPHAAAASQYLLNALFPAQFSNKANLAQAVQEELQRLLDAVQPMMSVEAYGELVSALASATSDRRVAGEEAGGGGTAEAEGEAGAGGGEPLSLPASTRPDESSS